MDRDRATLRADVFLSFRSQAASIAVELQCKGIDICVVHPSPVSSNFYDKVTHKIDSMDAFKKVPFF